MTPRLRRLYADRARLDQRLRNWPRIRVVEALGDPPEQYRIEFDVQGLEVTPGGNIQERSHHVVEIHLSLGYPRRMPHCKMLTPIFHPNFDPTSICIGDFWSAAEGLDDLVIRIGRMIAFQEYNTKSPLNGHAAKWAEEHPDLLPVDPREMAPPQPVEPEPDVALKILTGPDLEIIPQPLRPEPGAPTHSSWQQHSLENPDAVVMTPPTRHPATTSRNADDIVTLAPELSLLALRVRCDRCRHTFELELSALQGTVVCPHCRTGHEVGRTHECVVVENAGLFWVRNPRSP